MVDIQDLPSVRGPVYEGDECAKLGEREIDEVR